MSLCVFIKWFLLIWLDPCSQFVNSAISWNSWTAHTIQWDQSHPMVRGRIKSPKSVVQSWTSCNLWYLSYCNLLSVSCNSLSKLSPLYLTILDLALRISYSPYTQVLPLSLTWQLGSCMFPKFIQRTKPSQFLLEFFLLSATYIRTCKLHIVQTSYCICTLDFFHACWWSLSARWLFSIGSPQTHAHLSALCLSELDDCAVQHLGSLAGWLPVAPVLRVGSLPQQHHHCLGTFWWALKVLGPPSKAGLSEL